MPIRYLSGLSVDSTVLVVDAANDRVGIGTASPDFKLHLVGGSQYINGGQGGISNASPYTSTNRLIFNNDYNDIARGPNKITLYDGSWLGGFGVHDNTLAYYSGGNHNWYQATTATNAISLMTLLSSGNVGIGTTSPGGKLDVVPTSQNGINIARAGGYPSLYSSNDFVFETDGVFYFGVYTPRTFIVNNGFYVTTSGNTGIGTGTPSQKLDVSGYIRATSGFVGNGGLQLWGDNTSISSGLFVATAGNVGIGTTSPTKKLDVTGDGLFSSSGSGDTLTIAHSSGSGIGIKITKGGNGEGLYVDKTSGTGNAVTIIGTLNATTLVKSGGTSSQYLMADGSVSTLTNPVTGTGTTNFVPKWTSASAIGNSAFFDGGGFGGFNSSGLNVRTFVVNAASGRPLVLEMIEFANIHSVYIRPNNSGFNLISSNYMTGGIYLPLSLSARENNADFVIGTNGNVGIGTTAPANKLEVDGGSSAVTLRVSTTNTGSGVSALVLSNSSKSAFNDGVNIAHGGGFTNITDLAGTNIMSWDLSNTRVGIGTTTPGAKLDVNGNVHISNAGGALYFNRPQGATVGAIGWRASDDSFYVGGLPGYGENAGNDVRVRGFGANLILGTAGSDRVFITPAGNVGIGTTAPGAKLHVNPSTTNEIAIAINGTQNYSANSFQRISAGDASSLNRVAIGFGYNSTPEWTIRYSSYHNHEFFTGNDWGSSTEKMRITSAGNVGIGTTAPGTNLQIDATSSPTIRFNASSAAGGAGSVQFYNQGTQKFNLTTVANSNDFGLYNNGGTNSFNLYIQHANGAATFSNALQVAGQQAAANYGGTGLNFDFTSGNIGRIASVKTTSGGSQLQFFVYNTSGTDINALSIASTGAAIFSSSVTASSLIKTGGTSAQYLMADGSVSTLTNPVTGTGTTNYVPKFTSGSAIGDSGIFDTSGNIVINGTTAINVSSNRGNLTINGTTSILNFGISNIESGYIYHNGTTLGIAQVLAQPLLFLTTNAERMRITSAGNVLVGTTADNGYKLQISTNSSAIDVQGFYSIGNPIDILRTRYSGSSGCEIIFRGYNPNNNSDADLAIILDDASSNNNTLMYFDGSSQNVGIGTTAPAVRLDVVGANSAEGQLYVGNTNVEYSAGINFTTSGTNRGFVGWRHTYSTAPFNLTGIHLFNTDNSNIVFGTNNVVRAVIDTNGNVGINNTAPGSKLDVISGATQIADFRSTVVDGLSNIRIVNDQQTTSTGTSPAAIELVGKRGTSSHGRHAWIGAEGVDGTTFRTQIKFKIRPEDSPYQWSTLPTQMVIDGNGNVGIGTTAPTRRLTVANPANGDVALFTNTVDADLLINLTSGVTLLTPSTGTLAFGTSLNERMRITSAGNVGIGTTAPAYKLEVNGLAAADRYILNSVPTNSFQGSLTAIAGDSTYNILAGPANGPVIRARWSGGTANRYLEFGQTDNGGNYTAGVRIVEGNVGIGTTAPSSLLNIVASGSAPSALTVQDNARKVKIGRDQIEVTDLSDTAVTMYLQPNANLVINSSAGNVGIGVQPTQKLHVSGNIRVTGAYYDSNNSAGSSGQVLSSTGSGTDWVSLSEITGVDGTGTANYIAKWSDTDTITNSQVFDNGTNVGINNASPKTKLDVNGTIGFGSKSMSMTDTFAAALILNMNDHNGCYVKLTAFGDWSNHSTIAYLGEFFIQASAGSYNEPGIIIRQVDNTGGGDDIQAQILDPAGAGTRDFIIELKATSAANTPFTAYLQYEVRGLYNSVS